MFHCHCLLYERRDYRNVQLGYTEAENARQLLASHLNECRQSLETTTLTSEKLSRRVAVLEQSLADEKDDSQKLRDQLRRFQSAAIADDGAMVSFQPGVCVTLYVQVLQ